MKLLNFALLLIVATFSAFGAVTPINRGLLQSNLDGGGFAISNLSRLDMQKIFGGQDTYYGPSGFVVASSFYTNENRGAGSAIFGGTTAAGASNQISAAAVGNVLLGTATIAGGLNLMDAAFPSLMVAFNSNGTNLFTGNSSLLGAVSASLRGLNRIQGGASLIAAQAIASTNEATGISGGAMIAYASGGGRNTVNATAPFLSGRADGGTNIISGEAARIMGRAAAGQTLTASALNAMVFANADADYGSAAATAKNAIFFGAGMTNSTANSFVVAFGPTNYLMVTASGVGVNTNASGDVLKVNGSSTFIGAITNLDLTASQFVVSDANKQLRSTLDGSSLTGINPTNITAASVQSVTIPIGAFSTLNQSSPATSISFTNTSDGYAFTDAVTNTMRTLFSLPVDWTASTVQASIAAICTGTNHTTATNVVFGVRGAALGAGEDWSNPTFGTELWVTNHISTLSNIAGLAITGPLTVGNSPSPLKTILWEVRRLGAQAGDTLTNSSLAAVEFRLYYTRTNAFVGPTATVD